MQKYKSYTLQSLFILFINLFLINSAFASNEYPIIFVHGFLGFGPDEMRPNDTGYRYWGGAYDIEAALKEEGHKVYMSAVGPISSNWDRACELYAQIKGGQVDYGEVHAKKHGHKRFGRTYNSPFYPEWGEWYGFGYTKKIHLIGHSQGGQTIRVLSHLLKFGDEKEKQSENPSPLFKGGHEKWINSITTLSTPHDGSSLATGLGELFPLITTTLAATALTSERTILNQLYDFKLEHWGLEKEPEEDYETYLKRVVENPFWHSKDNSAHELTLEGAKELNYSTPQSDKIYYFSWKTSTSTAIPYEGYHFPNWDTNSLFYGTTLFIGSYQVNLDDPKSWFENDGIANTRSMEGPRRGTLDKIRPFDFSHIQRGVWQVMGKESKDHLAIIGFDTQNRDPRPFYQDMATFLKKLEK